MPATPEYHYHISDILQLYDGPFYYAPAVQWPGGPLRTDWVKDMERRLFQTPNLITEIHAGEPEETRQYYQRSYLVRGRYNWWRQVNCPSEFISVLPANNTVFATARTTYIAHPTRLEEIRGFWAQEILESFHGEQLDDYKSFLAEQADQRLYDLVCRNSSVWEIETQVLAEAVEKALRGVNLTMISPEHFIRLEEDVLRMIPARSQSDPMSIHETQKD